MKIKIELIDILESFFIKNDINYSVDYDDTLKEALGYFQIKDENIDENIEKYTLMFKDYLEENTKNNKIINIDFLTYEINEVINYADLSETELVINLSYYINENNIITGTNIIKLEKPKDNSFSNIKKNSDGLELGVCDNCKEDNVNIVDHICKTKIDLPMGENMLTNLSDFKRKILENKTIIFDDNQIKIIEQKYNSLPIKYHTNVFFKNIMDKLKKNKTLSVTQNEHLTYLLKYGKSMYENDYLTKKN